MPDLTYDTAEAIYDEETLSHYDMTDAQLARRVLNAVGIGSNVRAYGLVRAALARRVGSHARELLRARQGCEVVA